LFLCFSEPVLHMFQPGNFVPTLELFSTSLEPAFSTLFVFHNILH